MTTWKLSLFCLLGATLGQAQVITTVAGTDPIFLSKVLPALSASLTRAGAVAVDASGNFYLADEKANIVARVSLDGTLTVVAGNGRAGFSGDNGPASAASLSSPQGLALDSAGNLYIADTGNARVRKVSAGVITTVAGTGSPIFSGEGGPATSASIYPYGVAVDSAGNLYIGDTAANRVLRVASSRIATVAGNGVKGSSGDGQAPTAASLNGPEAIAIDSAGSIYISDSGNHRIRRVANGIITTFAGNGTPAFAGDNAPATSASLFLPAGIALDSTGSLYIADFGNNRVRKVANGTITTVAGNGTADFSGEGSSATSASLNSPTGVALDAAGNLYIADDFNARIRKVAGNSITTVAGTAAPTYNGALATAAILDDPVDVAVDSNGNLYIADGPLVRRVTGGTVTIFAGGGTSTADGVAATSAHFSGVTHLALDSSGSLYISETQGHRVRKVTNGIIATVAGNGTRGLSDGTSATTAMLANPAGIAVDSTGNLYIADQGNNRVRKVSGGAIQTIAGGGTTLNEGGAAISAVLGAPADVALDSTGTSVYIVESQNPRVRKVTAGIITTVAGNGTPGFSGDGGPATSASFTAPLGITLDTAGNLYISDTNNDRVRRVSNGSIATIAGGALETYAGDGGPAINAALFHPQGLVLDGSGNLFIADANNGRVREILVRAPSYQVSPAALSFTASAGGTPPTPQVLALASQVSGLAFTATADQPWLIVNTSPGSIPTTLQITADPSTLSAKTYTATITVTAGLALPSTFTVPVTFTVNPGTGPTLAVDTNILTLSAIRNGDAVSRVLTLTNTGTGSANYTATVATTSPGFSFTVTPAAGAVTPQTPVSLVISIDPTGLAPGTYSGTVTISGIDAPIPVTLSVSVPTATILLSQTTLTFTAVAQGGLPLPQTIGVLNTGQGTLSWTASANTLSGGNWLQISPVSGTVTQPLLDVSSLTVSVDPGPLAAGTYYGKIQVAGNAVNTPQLVTVILYILPPGTTLPPPVFPSSLIFTGAPGANPGSQDIQIGNPMGQATSYLSAMTGPGFAYAPTSARLGARQPTTLRVFPDFSNLPPGTTRQGSITLQFSDGSAPQSISVLLISPGATGPATASAHATHGNSSEPCDHQVMIAITAPAQNTFDAFIGQSVHLAAKVTDGCGIAIPANKANVEADLTGDEIASIKMTSQGGSDWAADWLPKPHTGTVQIHYSTYDAVPGHPGGVGALTSQLTATVKAAPAPTPSVTAEAVVQSASSVGGVPLAPGSLITVYGQNLSDATGSTNTLPLPQDFNGTTVFLGNLKLPILYADPGQLNLQVPFGVPLNTEYQMQVQRGEALSPPQSLVMTAGEPGIFTPNQQGTGQGFVFRTDGQIAQADTPARIGDTVVIYCTGLGSVSPEVPDGAGAPGSPLSQTKNNVTVTIGGAPARVDFAGLTPGYPGLYQINAVIPSGASTGSAVPVTITVAGRSSPPVTMAVK